MSRHHERGQIAFLFAFMLFWLALATALAVDGGYALFQERQSQNAVDLGATTAAELLQFTCTGAGNSPTGTTIVETINTTVAANTTDGQPSTTWVGSYLNSTSQYLAGITSASNPPSGACEIKLQLTSQWHTNLLSLIGMPHLATTVNAIATYSTSGSGELLT